MLGPDGKVDLQVRGMVGMTWRCALAKACCQPCPHDTVSCLTGHTEAMSQHGAHVSSMNKASRMRQNLGHIDIRNVIDEAGELYVQSLASINGSALQDNKVAVSFYGSRSIYTSISLSALLRVSSSTSIASGSSGRAISSDIRKDTT